MKNYFVVIYNEKYGREESIFIKLELTDSLEIELIEEKIINEISKTKNLKESDFEIKNINTI